MKERKKYLQSKSFRERKKEEKKQVKRSTVSCGGYSFKDGDAAPEDLKRQCVPNGIKYAGIFNPGVDYNWKRYCRWISSKDKKVYVGQTADFRKSVDCLIIYIIVVLCVVEDLVMHLKVKEILKQVVQQNGKSIIVIVSGLVDQGRVGIFLGWPSGMYPPAYFTNFFTCHYSFSTRPNDDHST